MIDRIKGALTRKIGPFPAWGWLGGGGVAYWIWRKRHPGSSLAGGSTAAPRNASQPLAYYGPYGSGGGGVMPGVSGGSSGGSTPTSTGGSSASPPTRWVIDLIGGGGKRGKKTKGQHGGKGHSHHHRHDHDHDGKRHRHHSETHGPSPRHRHHKHKHHHRHRHHHHRHDGTTY